MNDNTKNLQQVLRSLNSTQRQAVLSNAKSLQIIAGPGSGKTKVLVSRVSYLIIKKNIPPFNIIVVTFTKKAATELKERLKAIIGNQLTNLVKIGTFHSICCSVLRLNARAVNMEPNFKIIDEKSRIGIIRSLLLDESLPVKYAGRQIRIDQILKEIDEAKERGENEIKYQNLYGGCTSEYKRSISVFYQAYEEKLREANEVDFGGLILKTTELLRQNIGAFQSVDCVLIDEFQDTSSAQYELIKLIMAKSIDKQITVVGDPDQSIYGWRSAKSKIFVEMQDNFNGSVIVNLEQNYRSSAKVVEAASHIISQDTERISKALYTNNPAGPPISLIECKSEMDQAVYVAKEVERVIACSNGLVQYRDIAVLMRANFISQKFERVFRAYQIPFSLKGGERFFSRMEVKDILGYLKFAYNPYDFESFQRVINVPRRNIQPTTVKFIQEASMMHQVSLMDAIDIFLSSLKKFFLSDRKEMVKFVDLCKKIQYKIEEKVNVSDIIKFIYEEIEYYTYLRAHYFRDHVGRLKNISELVTMSKSKLDMFEEDKNADSESKDDTRYTTVVPNDDMVFITVKEEAMDIDLSQASEGATLGDDKAATTSEGSEEIKKFLDYCDSCLNEKQQVEKKGGKVTLSTIHASKGLEWPCVFVVSCVEGVIPASGGEINEEKRILYVAMTRAKFFLYCVSPLTIGDWGLSKSVCRSPFLENMAEDLYTPTSPVWNQGLLTMLASIINRGSPKENDFTQSSDISESFSSQAIPKTKSTQNTPFTLYQPYSSSSSPKTKITATPTYTYSSQQQTSSSTFAGLKRTLNDEDKSEDWLTITVKKEPKNDDDFDF